jgi:uncharacterized membrane-anchored protein YhcB (DUF1043 family)
MVAFWITVCILIIVQMIIGIVLMQLMYKDDDQRATTGVS